MRTRTFGSTGIQVPIIGQGTWQLRDPGAAATALNAGLDAGLTHIDTAELYKGSEAVVAKAVAGRRDDVFLVSKVLPSNASYQGTLEACSKSLALLGTDHLDVYLLHWWSDRHPIEETMRAMGELVDSGKTRFVGVSNLDVEELERAQQALGRKHKIVCDQVYYEPTVRGIENELLAHCQKKGIAIVGYSPFGSGQFPRPGSRGRKELDEVAKSHGATAHQVVLSWLARPEGMFLIPKAETMAHVQSNAAALDVRLSAEEIARLDAAFPVPSPGPLQVI